MATHILINLTSGVWVIGSIKEQHEDYMVLDTPMTVEFAHTPNGQLQVGLMPYGYPVIQNDPSRGYEMPFFTAALITTPQPAPQQLSDLYTQSTSRIDLSAATKAAPNLVIAK